MDGDAFEATDPPKRILVTGGGGFVGRRLVHQLGARSPAGARIITAHRSGGGEGSGPNAVELALEDPESVMRAVRETEPDIVIHLAAQSSVGSAMGSAGAAATWEINAGGALSLAKALASFAPTVTLLFASSAEVYGKSFNDGPADETATPQPQTAYSRSKLAAEQIFTDVLPPTAKLIIARPGNHSGAGQDERFVLPSFAAQMGRENILVGNLDAERDFLHVDDVVDAYLALLSSASSLGSRNVFNVSMGSPVSVRDLLHRMLALSGSSAAVTIDHERLRPNEIPRTELVSEKIRQAVGWRPRRTLDDILHELVRPGPQTGP